MLVYKQPGLRIDCTLLFEPGSVIGVATGLLACLSEVRIRGGARNCIFYINTGAQPAS
jgi:hypothetical protein